MAALAARPRNSRGQALCDEEYDLLEQLRTKLNFKYGDKMLTLLIRETRLWRLEFPSSSRTGPIPRSVFKLTHLRILNLAHNKLNGQLPEAVSELCCLTRLDLSGNDLSGPITSALGRVTSLTELDLANNRFSGPLPGALRRLTNLRYIDLTQRGIALNMRQFWKRGEFGAYAKCTTTKAVAAWRETLPLLEADVAAAGGGAVAAVSPSDSDSIGGSGAFKAAFGTASGGSPSDDGTAAIGLSTGTQSASAFLGPPPSPASPPAHTPSGVPSPPAEAATVGSPAVLPGDHLGLPPTPPPRLAATAPPSYASSSDYAYSSAPTSTGGAVVGGGVGGILMMGGSTGSSAQTVYSNGGGISPAEANTALFSEASSDTLPSSPASGGTTPPVSGSNSVAGMSAAAAAAAACGCGGGGGGSSEVEEWLREINIMEKRIPVIMEFLESRDFDKLSVLADMEDAECALLLAELKQSHADTYKLGTEVAFVRGLARLRLQRGNRNEEAAPKLLGGRYRDEEHHHTSKTAVVVFATDAYLASSDKPSDGALVAIKRFQHKALFDREMSVLKHLNKSVAVVVASGAGGGVIALHSSPEFAETVEGRLCYHLVTRRGTRGSLHDVLVRKTRAHPIEPDETFRFGIAATTFLAQVHAAGTVWAGLAPEHFLLVEQGRLAAIDFESSASITSLDAANDLDLSDRQSAFLAGLELHHTGVPSLLSPEGVRRCRSPYVGPVLAAAAARGETSTARPAHDMWPLGAMLYLLASGQELDLKLPKPLEKTDLKTVDAAINTAIAANVPQPWARAVKMALQADPGDRKTAAAVAAELREAEKLWAASVAAQASGAKLHGVLSGIQGDVQGLQGNVGELVRGETRCPRLFLLLPPPEQQQSSLAFNLLARAKAAMQSEMRLVFCCACGGHTVRCGPDGAGFVVKFPTKFAGEYRVVLEAGLMALRIALQWGVAAATSGALHIQVPLGQLLPTEAFFSEYATSLFDDAETTAEKALLAGTTALVSAASAETNAMFAGEASGLSAAAAAAAQSGGNGSGGGNGSDGSTCSNGSGAGGQPQPQLQSVTADAYRKLVNYMDTQHSGWEGWLGNMAACASSGGPCEWVCPLHKTDFVNLKARLPVPPPFVAAAKNL